MEGYVGDTDLLEKKRFFVILREVVCGTGPLDPGSNYNAIVYLRRHVSYNLATITLTDRVN